MNCVKHMPEWLVLLHREMESGLRDDEAETFRNQIVELINSADFDRTKKKFLAFLVRDNIKRVRNLSIDEILKTRLIAAMQGCLDVHISAMPVGTHERRLVHKTAINAMLLVRATTRGKSAEAESSAEDAVWAAAFSVDFVLGGEHVSEAAFSSAAAASESGFESMSSAWRRYRDELLRLLKEAA